MADYVNQITQAVSQLGDVLDKHKKGEPIFNLKNLARNTSNIYTAAGNLISGVLNKSATNHGYDYDGANAKMDAGLDTAANLASSIPGVGPLISVGMKLNNAITRRTDTNMDALTDADARFLNVNKGASNAGAFVSNLIPGVAPIEKLLTGEVNATPSLNSYAKLSGGWTGVNLNNAQMRALNGKNLGLNTKGANQLNSLIASQTGNTNAAARVSYLRQLDDSAGSLSQQNLIKNMGGIGTVRVGKEGGVIPEYEAGGVIGVDSSIIPEGALHKELNHMDKVNPEVDEVITDKGIPIVAVDKDGNIEQIAEVEKEELIITLELTKKIDALRKKEDKEEAAIEAGKLLAEELFNNTQDNTGQLTETE